ncbi:hypothetical protein APY03_7571 [Variovorax sp. WDL1]|nr:hypothetical protein APY03_7571 [Variovorax sp. WDL1]
MLSTARAAASAPSGLDPVDPLHAMLLASGYTDLRVVDGVLCAVRRFNFTTAIIVGLDPVGYVRRYCYEHGSDARAALAAWNGREHPPAPWIKCKGAGIDLLNPSFA